MDGKKEEMGRFLMQKFFFVVLSFSEELFLSPSSKLEAKRMLQNPRLPILHIYNVINNSNWQNRI